MSATIMRRRRAAVATSPKMRRTSLVMSMSEVAANSSNSDSETEIGGVTRKSK